MDTTSVLLEKNIAPSIKAAGIPAKQVLYTVPATTYTRYLKRCTDVIFATILSVLLLSWLIPVLFILIRISSRGPLFFVQERTGLNGRQFSCIKFRTMKVNRHSNIRQAGSDDERITKLGFFLRITHIDELPQLLNVLRNDMSMVGPRPHMLYHDELFSSTVPGYSSRHNVKPGITGLAQASGYHGATPDFRSIASRTRLDLFYVRKISFLLDLKILLATFFMSPFKFFVKRWR